MKTNEKIIAALSILYSLTFPFAVKYLLGGLSDIHVGTGILAVVALSLLIVFWGLIVFRNIKSVCGEE